MSKDIFICPHQVWASQSTSGTNLYVVIYCWSSNCIEIMNLKTKRSYNLGPNKLRKYYKLVGQNYKVKE